MSRSSKRPNPPPDHLESPLYLLAVLFSVRRSKDRALEQITRRRLESLGVQITFADELPSPTPTPTPSKGGVANG